MDTDRDTTRIVRSWLVEGRTALPDHILDAVLDQAAATPQRRPAWLARRLPPMGMPIRIAAAAAVVVIAAVFGISLLSGAFGGVGGLGPAATSPSPSPTLAATPAAVDPCLVGTWTTAALSQNSPANDQAIDYSGGGGEVFTIDAQGAVTIDTHAAQRAVWVATGQTFSATVTGTGRGTLTTLTSGSTSYFHFTPSADDTRTTLSMDSTGAPLGPARADTAFTAIYTCAPGRSFTFYKTVVDWMIDGPMVTLTEGSGGSSSTASPSLPSATPIDTASWTTYTSTRFGFSIGHPADWSLRPADHDWVFSQDAGDTSHPPGFTAWDFYLSSDSSIAVSAWSVAVTPGTTVQSWLQAYCPIAESDSPCTSLQGLTIPVTVDGHAGSIVKFTEDTQAFFIVNDRMYVVASWRPAAEFDSLSTLQAFLSTMHLLPGGPASATPTP